MGTDEPPPFRVAFDVGPLYGHRTGIGHAVAGLSDALARRDDVDLEPYMVSFRSRPDDGHRRLPLPGLLASWLWSHGERPSADRWLGPVDVVHATNYSAPPSALPTIVSVYDCWFLEHPGDASPVVRRAGRRLRRSVERGAWVHACSTATADRVREVLSTDRVVTVHLGPPPPLPTASATTAADEFADRRYLVAIGTEERRKGLPLLVAAFAEVSAHVPGLHLVMAGSPGDDSAAVDAAVDALPASLAGRVHRLGIVDDRVKARLLARAEALAYPSLDEGFGFPILEAQAAGTPVVATDVGSVAEVAGDAALLVAERTPESFAEALLTAVSADVRTSLVAAGHRNLARFDWSATADGLVDAYRTAVEHPR